MVCDVNQELSPTSISIYCGTGCSQSLITSDCLAGIGNSDTGHSLALTSVMGGGGGMVVWLHTVFLCSKCDGINRYGGGEGRKEGNVLFKDTLNTFYLRVIWRHTYSDSKRKPAAAT